MAQIWLTAEEVMELGVPRATLFWQIQKGKIVTREGLKAKNGKQKTEISLTSLPGEMQGRWFSRQKAVGSRQEENGGSENIGDADEAMRDATTAIVAEAGANLPSASLSPASAQGAESQISNLRSQIGNPLVGLSEEKFAEITEYAETLRQAQGAPRARRRWIARRAKVSLATLDRDLKAFRERGMAALVRARRADAGRSRVADRKVVRRIQDLYLQTYQPSIVQIHQEIAKDYALSNLTPPSYSFVARVVGEIDPDLVGFARVGEREYRNKFAYYSQRRRPALPRQWADADHHQWDRPVIFRDGSIGRPWLTAIRDLCTSEVLGFSVNANQSAGKYSNRRTISYVLRRAILRKADPRWKSFGLFDNFLHDLGKDFRSKHVRAICHDLSIRPRPTRGYHGQSKPIERWFRYMEGQLKHLPGYIGNKPENNPERQKIGAPRTWEEMRKELMTIDELEAALLEWILNIYHFAPSKGLKGLSPMEVLESHVKRGFSPREVRDERALDLLMMERLDRGKKPLVVRRGKIQAFGTKWAPRYFEAPELLELSDREVQAFYDPDELGALYIYKDNHFVCVATNAELIDFGATAADMERRLQMERHQRRRRNERIEEIRLEAQYPDPLKRAISLRMQDEVLTEERKQIAAGAEPARTVGQMLPKYQRAVKQMRAVGSRQRAGGKLAEVKRQKEKVKSEEAERNPYIEEKKLAASEIFKREENEYLDDEDI